MLMKVKERYYPVSRIAISCLCSLGHLFSAFYELDKSIIKTVFHELIEEIKRLTSPKDPSVASAYINDLLNALTVTFRIYLIGVGIGRSFWSIIRDEERLC